MKAGANWSDTETGPSAAGGTALRLQLLGGFQVWVDGHLIPASGWRLRKARSLIKLLALAPHHRLHREQILESLWPDHDLKAATHGLHQVLYVARQALGAAAGVSPPGLQSDGDILHLGSPGSVWVDVEAFLVAAGEARRSQQPAAYHAALDLYGGELLPEDRFEEWASGRREQVRREHLQLLVELARLYELQQRPARAIETLRRALVSDPACEDIHRHLMRLYGQTGQRQQALRQYALLRQTLRRELDVEPDVQSQLLYQELLADRLSVPETPAGAPGAVPAVTFPGRTTAPGTPAVSPASEARPTNLPVPLTRMVGRERELAQVLQLAGASRLLTLTGTAGCGKTMLAREAASRLVERFPDGVWLADFAAVTDPGSVAEVIIQTLGLPREPRQPAVAALVDALRAKQVLLVLDNCEHLAIPCAHVAAHLLRGCPALQVLCTSQQPLGVPGELTWPVPPLSLPDRHQALSPATLMESDAVRVFVERVRTVVPDWTLGDQHAVAVAQICWQLDGLPLALELAAARVKALTVEQIAARLDDCLRLLTGGSRTALPRHQSLRAALDWSYALLTPPEQTWFRQLGVFPGSFTLDAVDTVCAGERDETGTALEVMTALVEKSLVLAETGAEGVARYRLLAPVRQYAWGRLLSSGEAAAVQRRYAAYARMLPTPGIFAMR